MNRKRRGVENNTTHPTLNGLLSWRVGASGIRGKMK
jgi:hypothetical protein